MDARDYRTDAVALGSSSSIVDAMHRGDDMAIYCKEFYRLRLPKGNHVAWSIRFDTESGNLLVRSARTSQSAHLYDQDMTPSEFLKSGNRKEQRVFRSELASLVAKSGLKEEILEG